LTDQNAGSTKTVAMSDLNNGNTGGFGSSAVAPNVVDRELMPHGMVTIAQR
jgi:hypothetical protein